jgi:hypothetical protein
MTLIATDVQRYSNVIKNEYDPASRYCRKVVTVYEATAKTYVPGRVLTRFLDTGAATAAAAAANTGNGTMGTITVYDYARKGTYMLRVVATASNAGVFIVTDPDGNYVGTGNVAAAFNGGGITFTLADGSTDFAVGDAFAIAVTGTEKYKTVEESTINGSLVVFIGDNLGNAQSTAIAATTDTKVVVIAKGPALVADAALTYGSTITTATEKQAVYDALEGKGINVETQI